MLHLPRLADIVSEMSATFIKGKVSEGVGVMHNTPLLPVGETKSQQLSSQEEVTALSLDNLTCRRGTQGVSLAITQQRTRMQPQLGHRGRGTRSLQSAHCPFASTTVF